MPQNYADNVDTQFLFYGHKYESFIMCVDEATDFLSTKRDPNHYSQDLTRYDKSCVESGKSYINNLTTGQKVAKVERKGFYKR